MTVPHNETPLCQEKGCPDHSVPPSPYDIAREQGAILLGELDGDQSYMQQMVALLSLKIQHEGKTICFRPYWEDAELPEIPEHIKDFGGNDSIYEEAQQDMLKAGWVKSIKEEK